MLRSLTVPLLAVGLSGLLPGRAARADAEAALGPLPEEAAAALAAIRPDRPPAELIRDSHYIVSNEDRPQAFREALRDRGGLYVGVGSEQNYLFAGWCRPEVMVLTDFDQLVVDLHRVYRAFFQAAEDAAAFQELWLPGEPGDATDGRVLSLLARAYPGQAGVVRAYRRARHAVPDRLAKLRRLLGAAGVRFFLDDPEQYGHLRGLARAGRMFSVRGDLTADRTFLDLAAAARKADLPVRVLYLSNAEKYFPYGAEFKQNMLALPFDDRSIVLRTGARKLGAYVYFVQEGPAFQAWLRKPGIQSVHQIARLRDRDPSSDVAFILRPPDARQTPSPRP